MEKALTEHSASDLRVLLIKEIRNFIERLDYDSTDELQEMKKRLKEIFNILAEKERLEMAPLQWGKNSPKKDASPSDLPIIDLLKTIPYVDKK